MKLNLSFSLGDDKPTGPVAETVVVNNSNSSYLDEGWAAVLKAWGDANDPAIDLDEQAKRMQWIGGAVKLYAVMSGRDPSDVTASLPPAASASTDRYSVVPGRMRPVETKRPPKHPGAQRPVEPTVFEPYSDEEFESSIVVEDTPAS